MKQDKSRSDKFDDRDPADENWGQPPTSQDVAKLANVSRATVSYVLNDAPGKKITEETRNRVLDAAAELGYIPNRLASSLRSGHSDLVILPFFDWPYNQNSISFLQELAAELDELGYTVMLRFFRKKDKKKLLRKIASFHPIGVIIYSETLSQEDVEILKRNGVKALLSYDKEISPSVPTMWLDFSVIGKTAGNYLIEKGYQRIAAVIPKDKRIHDAGIERFEGVRQICEEAGVPVERIDLDYDLNEAIDLADRWKHGPRPDAIFTYNDEYGMMLLSALQKMNIDVPSEIALVGCDNLPICEMLNPRLTSVSFDYIAQTHNLATHLHHQIQGKDLTTLSLKAINCEIIERESS